jgi:FMN phosphatase YigB (HAD superfamily)
MENIMFNRFFLISSIIIIPFLAESKMIETPRIADVKNLVDDDAWVLVDFDNTLFQAKQALGHAAWFYDEVDQGVQKGLSHEEAVREAYVHWVKVQKYCFVQPLEEDFIPFLTNLQDRGVVVLGLTLRQPMVAESTMRQVDSLGIDFLKTAPVKEDFDIPAKSHAIYLKGTLFASDYNKKGEIFETFLSMISQSPKKIVFIDDKKKNVEELGEVAEKLGIDYIGVYYTAIEQSMPIYFRELAAFQYKMLEKILSNEAAMHLLEKGIE